MSVSSTADDHIISAKEYIESAIQMLGSVVNFEASGSDDYTDTYWGKIVDAYMALLKMRRELR